MMDDSTSATAGADTAMHHSAGYTIEQTKQQDRMASRSAQGILYGGRVVIPRNYVKIQLVNIATVADTGMRVLTEKGSPGIEACENILHFSARIFQTLH